MRRALFALAPIIVIAIAVIAVTGGHPAAETTHAGFLDPTMSLVVKQGGTGVCDSRLQTTEKCLISKGSFFTLSVELKGGTPALGYGGFRTLVTWTGQPTKDQLNFSDSQIVWPDCLSGGSVIGTNLVFNGCESGVGSPFPASSYKGNLVDLFFECKSGTEVENIKFDLISLFDEPGGAALMDTAGFWEPVPGASLKIACVPQDGQININVVNADDWSQKLPDTCWLISVNHFDPESEQRRNTHYAVVSDNNARPECDVSIEGGLSDKDPTVGRIAVTIPAAAMVEWESDEWHFQQLMGPDNYTIDPNKYACTLSGLFKKTSPNKEDLIACDEADPYTITNTAKPPPKDSFLDPTIVGGLPYTDSVVTKAATSAANDPPIIICKVSYGHSVWYKYTPAADQTVTADTFGSNYDTVLAVFKGSKDSLNMISCNDDAAADPQSQVIVKLTGGTTYYFLVGSWSSDSGGKLVFNMEEKTGLWYDRIVVDIGTSDQLFKVAFGWFECQLDNSYAPAVFTDHLKDVNPEPDPYPHHEVWSGTFPTKCMSTTSGVVIKLIPVIATNALLIKACRVENTTTGDTAPCNVDPNPGVPDGEGIQNFKATVKPAGKLAWPGDTDGDGCADESENQPKEDLANGGGRDWQNPWDYYDVDGDGVINLFGDILGVITHFSLDGLAPYDVAFDRGPSAGPNPWNMTAPDGVINLFTDILGVIKQFTLKGCTDPGA